VTAATSIYETGEYLAKNPGWHDGDGQWKANQIAAILDRNSVRPTSVCDVGCGTGRVLRELSRALPGSPRMVGFDIAAEPLAISGAQPAGVELVAADARSSAEHFDLLLMIGVVEHVEDYLGFLRAFRDRADRFVFHIPLELSVQTVLRATPLLGSRHDVGHLHYFGRETALATLADAGFRVIDEQYTTVGGRRLARVPRQVARRLSPDLAARVLGGFSLLVLAEAS
jgi:SAM-dependent methyltransferase